MAFLFKSKKNQKEAAAATKAEQTGSVAGSQPSLHSANGRGGSKDEKDGLTLSQTPTPTGSVNNSINSFQGNAPSPDTKGVVRRGTGLEQQLSDLPVSFFLGKKSHGRCRCVLIIANTERSYETHLRRLSSL